MYKYLILILFSIGQAGAQSAKYKYIVPLFDGMSRDEKKNVLKEYMMDNDMDHPNAVFRLALIYEGNYREADVLARYEYVLANAEQAKLGYTKAKILIDEREVSKNNDFYFPIFKTLDVKGRPNVAYDVVDRKITQGYDSAVLYLEKVPPIYKSFTRSVNYYDNAVKIFSEINNDFLSLADVYLFLDPALDAKLIRLKQNYDSARFYFDRYLTLTKEFPIPYHKQKYHVKPIVTYRLDGLITRMNFLTNDLAFWNYGEWVDHVHKSVSGEIGSLRKQLSQNEVRLSENLARIETTNGEGISVVMPDKELVFNLNNFDKQSLALSLIEFKAFKQDWLLKAKAFVPDTANLERDATSYSALMYANRTADTLINRVKNRSTNEKIAKHNEFIGKHYGGQDGLQKFTNIEKENIRITYEQYSGGLRASVLGIATRPVVPGGDKVVRFGRLNVSMTARAATPELLAKGEAITLLSKKSPDGSVYLVGIQVPDKKTNATVTYVARVNADGKPAWIQHFSLKVDSVGTATDAHNFPGPFELTQEGCAFIVRSVHLAEPEARNSLIYLNEKGEQKFLLRLPEKSYARNLNFTERSNSFVLLFKGSEEKPNHVTVENMTLLRVNALGDILWRRKLPFAGTSVDMINLLDGHMIIGNYSSLKDLQGKEHKARPGETSPFLVNFGPKGDVEGIHPIATARPLVVIQVVKVNDRSINLLGWEGTVDASFGKSISPGDDFVHMMCNRKGEVVCSNLSK
ncbi:MAG: hypothetical protein SH819_07920 [Cytophagales bacterium]|nr:hypothetical protein [Cytophagales bacterium]